MSGFNIFEPLILLMLAGYMLLARLKFLIYAIQWDSGYHVILKSTFAGFILLMVSSSIVYTLDFCFENSVNKIEGNLNQVLPLEFDLSIWGMFLLSIASPPIFNRFRDDERDYRKFLLEKGNTIDILIYYSFLSSELLQITLRNRKVYIGVISYVAFSDRENSIVTILPFYSGYRNKDTNEFTPTTNYRPIIQQFIIESASMDSDAEFDVSFPKSEIIVIRQFDEQIYENFFQ